MDYSSTRSKSGCSQDAGMFNRLPPELWLDILSLLPVKPLVVLGSVCKSFLSIIHDPHFVSLHLRRFPGLQRPLNPLPHLQLTGVLEIRDISNSLEPISRLIIEPGLEREERVVWCLLGSLDGLYLILSIPLTDTASRTTVLWNPSIRKLRQLTPPNSPGVQPLGLGHHSSCEDYKVVATSLYRDEAWIYSVKTGSWSELINSGFSCKVGNTPNQCLSINNGVVWIETSCFRSGDDRLVLFDFRTERFRYTDKMPYSTDYKVKSKSCWRVVILDCGSSVGVLGFDDPLEQASSIWALETDTMSWTRRYKIPQDMPNKPLWDAGRAIFEKSGELVCKYWTRYSVAVLSWESEAQAMKHHHEFSAKVQSLGVYVESLVML